MKLNDYHTQHLKEKNRISEDVINRAGLISIDSNDCVNRTGHSSTAIAFPYYDLKFDDLIDYRLRFDNPKLENGKEQRYSQPAGSSLTCYFLKDEIIRIKNSNIDLAVMEGEKKMLALESCENSELKKFAKVATPGCYSWGKNGQLSPAWEDIPLNGRKVAYFGDTDVFTNQNVKSGYLKHIKHILNSGAEVKFIDLRIKGIHEKIGLDDFLSSSSEEELVTRINEPLWVFKNPPGHMSPNEDIDLIVRSSILSDQKYWDLFKKFASRMAGISAQNLESLRVKYLAEFEMEFELDDEIIWSSKIHTPVEVCIKAVKKLEKLNELILVNNQLTLINTNNNTFQIMSDTHEFKNYVRQNLTSREITKTGVVNKVFPEELAEIIFTAPVDKYFQSLPKVKSIQKLPAYNGGYQHEIRSGQYGDSYYLGEPIVPTTSFVHVPKILDSIAFKTELDKVNYLGCLIGLLYLADFPGSHPAYILRGDMPNIGKSTAGEILQIISSGLNCSNIGFNSNEAEMEKVIGTMIQKSNVVMIDNIKVSSVYSSQLLERTITDHTIQVRLLGHNKFITRVNDVQFIMTINGGTFSEDLVTRSVIIDLSSSAKCVRDFSIEVEDYVKLYRTEIIAELCGLVHRSKINLHPWSPSNNNGFRFPRWRNKITEILDKSGHPGFLRNYDDKLKSADAFTALLIEAVERDLKCFARAVTAGEVCARINEDLKTPGLMYDKVQVGKKLTQMSGKEFNVEYNENFYYIRIAKGLGRTGGNNSAYVIIIEPISTNKDVSWVSNSSEKEKEFHEQFVLAHS